MQSDSVSRAEERRMDFSRRRERRTSEVVGLESDQSVGAIGR
jgi:hypothetical protein